MAPYDESGAEPRWTPVAKAAQLAGLHVDTLRNWVRKGEVRSMRDNRRRLMIDLRDLRRHQGVSLDAYDGAEDATEVDHRLLPITAWTDELRGRIEALSGEIERLRGAELTVARLEERRAADEEAKAVLRERIEELKADLDRERRRAEGAERRQAERDRQMDEVLRRLDELQEERRRSWPGLRRWWRRFVEGEG